MAEKVKNGLVESLKDAIVDEDKELNEEVPGSPYLLVGLGYFLILLIVFIGFGLFYWLRL